MNVRELDGWLPCRVHWQAEGPLVEWFYAGRERLTDPFYEMTVRRAMERPYRAMFRRVTPMAALLERAAASPGIPPTGFIFHLSRCGSTLISQMLAASTSNLVAAEPNPLEDLVWSAAWLGGLTEETLLGWLRALIGVMGQPRVGSEARYFVKFDPLQTIALPLFRKAFPETPWLFLYRDPVEILVSLERQTPAFAIPGAAVGGFSPVPPAEAVTMTPGDYAARVLGRIGSAAADRLESGDGMAVCYPDLPNAVRGKISRHFAIDWSPEELCAMEAACQFDAKSPSTRFIADSGRKQREASPELRASAAKWLDPVFQRLEAVRQRTQGID